MAYVLESAVQAVTWGLFAFFVMREVVLRAHEQQF